MDYNGAPVKLYSLGHYLKKFDINKATLFRSLIGKDGLPVVNEATVGRIIVSGSGMIAEDENGATLLITKAVPITIEIPDKN